MSEKGLCSEGFYGVKTFELMVKNRDDYFVDFV